MSFFEDILLGSISKGVNKPTLILLNLCLFACIALLLPLIFLQNSVPPDVLPHLVVLLFFAIALSVCVNWMISETGIVSAKVQRQELFGEELPVGDADTDTNSKQE